MSPVRSHWIFDSKYCIKTEVFLKSKGRWVIDGTTRAMRYNEHFWESFSPAPNPIATRIMQSIACGYDKKRYAADVEVAAGVAATADARGVAKVAVAVAVWLQLCAQGCWGCSWDVGG